MLYSKITQPHENNNKRNSQFCLLLLSLTKKIERVTSRFFCAILENRVWLKSQKKRYVSESVQCLRVFPISITVSELCNLTKKLWKTCSGKITPEKETII